MIKEGKRNKFPVLEMKAFIKLCNGIIKPKIERVSADFLSPGQKLVRFQELNELNSSLHDIPLELARG